MYFIIKTIQSCNLSCVYCYEQPQNKRNVAMSLDDARCFLQKVYDHYARNEPEEVLFFHWHGGEPMLKGADFFKEIIAFQRETFGDTVRWCNTIQSNLTLLDDSFVDLFKTYPDWLSLGVSYDFFGHDRVDRRNRDVNARVWRNINRLQEAGIPTNLITMLTKGNIEHLDEIYEQVRFKDISIRFNQVFGAPRNRPFGRPPVRVTNRQFCRALQHLTHRWINDSECSFVMHNAERMLMKIVNPFSTHLCWFQKNCLEGHMAVCPDGTVYPCDVVYLKDFSYGNIFTDPYEEILSSEPRRQLLNTLKGVQPACEGCEYVNYCNGGCPMRSMFSMPAKDRRLSTDFRFGRDPLCATHRGMFEMIGTYLVNQGLVEADWTRRQLQ